MDHRKADNKKEREYRCGDLLATILCLPFLTFLFLLFLDQFANGHDGGNLERTINSVFGKRKKD